MLGWGILARYALWAALILGFVGSIWWGAHTIHDKIYNDGVTAEKEQWEKREAQLSAERNAKLKAAETRAVEIERDSNKKMAEIETNHLQEKEKYEKQKAIDIAAARAGTLKLQWTSKEAPGRGSDRNATTPLSGTTSFCDGAKGGELPPEIAADLFELSFDADEIVSQLTQCQSVIKQDRNTPPSKPN